MAISRWIVSVLFVMLIQTGCGQASHTSGHSNSTILGSTGGAGGSVSYTADPALEAQALAILGTNCSGCHGGSTGPAGVSDILNASHLIASGLIVPGNPNSGRIMTAIQGGVMPPTGALPAASVAVLQNWITSMVVTSGPSTPPPPPAPVVLEPTWSNISKNILQPKCVACHGAVNPTGGIRFDSYARAVRGEIIIPGNAGESDMYDMVSSGEMPPASAGYARLSAAELSVIRTWINIGAPNN